MCNPEGIRFCETSIRQEEVRDKDVLEVGAMNVNGSVRSFIEGLSPRKYLGVDIAKGEGVDETCNITELVSRYGEKSFDLVIATEVVEHVRQWQLAVSNLKCVLRTKGLLLLTTRSRGFPYHGYPHDFWRYEVTDMNVLFSDMLIEANVRDPSMPGVFVRARRPQHFDETDLSAYRLFSMVRGKPCISVNAMHMGLFALRRVLWRWMPRNMKERVKRIASMRNA